MPKLENWTLPEILGVLATLIVCILGAHLITRARREVQPGSMAEEFGDLDTFRRARDAGHIDDEEFNRLRLALERRKEEAAKADDGDLSRHIRSAESEVHAESGEARTGEGSSPA